jgi:hypothetical protein
MPKPDEVVEQDLALEAEWKALTMRVLQRGFSAGRMKDFITAELNKTRAPEHSERK